MPIRPEYRRYYGADWRAFRVRILDERGRECERCGRTHRLLNVAHLTHDPADRRSIAVFCPSCHASNDSGQRLAMMRRTRAERCGQLWLSDEIRLTPFPMRIWPAPLRQMRLFG